MTEASLPRLFAPDTLQAWARLASADPFVRRHRVLADLAFGLHRRDGPRARFAIGPDGIQATPDGPAPAFHFEGDADAFEDLARGLPFNRLVRQHRLVVGGDLRLAVQNWLLVYAVTRLAGRLGREA